MCPPDALVVVEEPERAGGRCGEKTHGSHILHWYRRAPRPRFLNLGKPLCPNCTQSGIRKILMKGSVPDPTGKSSGLFFVCERCRRR